MGMAVQRTDIPIGANKARWIHDPTLNQRLEASHFAGFQGATAPQSVQIPIGIQSQLRWGVVPGGQLLTGITQRLEVSNGFRMLKGCHL
jgi:hypothetical protein